MKDGFVLRTQAKLKGIAAGYDMAKSGLNFAAADIMELAAQKEEALAEGVGADRVNVFNAMLLELKNEQKAVFDGLKALKERQQAMSKLLRSEFVPGDGPVLMIGT